MTNVSFPPNQSHSSNADRGDLPLRGGPRRVVISASNGRDPDWPTELSLVLVHGSMDRGAGMARLTRQLSGAETIRYDRRGYGHALALGTTEIEGHVDDLVSIVGERKVVVFGHSFGAVVALTAAAQRRSDIRAVMVYEPPTPWADWWPDWVSAHDLPPSDLAETFMRAVIGDDRWEGLPARTRAKRRSEGGALSADLKLGDDGIAPFAPAAIDVPTVIAYGTASPSRYQDAAEMLASQTDSSELHRLDGLEHAAPFHTPTEIAKLIRRAAHLGCETHK